MPVLRSICIGDLGRVVTGKTPPSAQPELFGNLYPFITPTDMDWDVRYVEPDRFLSLSGKEYQNRLMLPAAAVCVVCIGATIGKVCMTRCPSFTNQQINSVVVNEKEHDPFFVYHLLTTLRDELKSNAGGAATPIINKTIFSEIKVNAPSLPVQKRIAGILSAYDDLIENSQRRIKILEAMARGLYREWFIHFRFPGHENHPRVSSALGEIPQGWEVKKLGDIAENFDRMRKPLSKMERSQLQGEYPYYGAAKVFDYVNDYIFDGEYLLLAEDGSVITPQRTPVLQLVKEKFWPNNHTHVLRGLPTFSTHFLYLGLSEVDISPYITGAAQPKITQENMNRIPFFCGPKELHLEFNRLVEPMILKSHILQSQVKNLRRTRDLLLPRLLSGQINVEAAEHV
jgi:type I restriction enzyme S subunit